MTFINPSKYFWNFIETFFNKEDKSIDSSRSFSNSINIPSTSENIVIVSKGFLTALKSKDWGWLLQGKTGIFLKISVPLLILLYSIFLFIPKKENVPAPVIPDKIDLGDILERPKFVSSNYLNGSFSEGKFLVYSKDAGLVNEFGVRGILLSSTELKNEYAYYYPLSKNSYVYLDKGILYLNYKKTVQIPKSYPIKYKEVEESVLLLGGILDSSKIVNFHKNYEDDFGFVLDDTFYVYNSAGELLTKYSLQSGMSNFTYYRGEIYFIRSLNVFEQSSVTEESSSKEGSLNTNQPSSTKYFLVKLNKNNEEVYSQELGDKKVQQISIISDNRFLILFESPSDNSFYNIQMRDSGKRIIFNVTPVEEEVKITKVNNFYFSSIDNTIFLQGNGVAKLFNLNGEQLWIN